MRIGGRRDDWRCISGYGHAPEHIALHCDALRVLISGDMVLPRISTNVSVVDVEPEADPLTLYPRLDRALCARSPPTRWCCRRTASRSRGLHTRIDQLHDAPRERFAEMLEACAEAPQSAAELLPVLFKRKLDLHQMTFAMGESIAHLHALWFRGKLARAASAAPTACWRFARRLTRRSRRSAAAQSKTGSTSSLSRAARRLVVRDTERTTSQKRGLWFISRRCASSWATT